MTGPIHLAFLWHMHQPFYKNLMVGTYYLPWVLLHATKDYLDMPLMLKGFPGLKQNFNLVPSLMVQLLDYAKEEVRDLYLEVFDKSPADLSEAERGFIVTNYFSANWDRMVKRYPRYWELLRKRGLNYRREALKEVQGYFNDEDLRDLQVLFFLAWIDPVLIDAHDDLKALVNKGRGFTEGDKAILRSVQRDIVAAILPTYRELVSAGSVELSTSPFYHPIMPLLIDRDAARESMPWANLPQKRFRHPDDARAQLRRGLELFEEVFAFRPQGMWPPEGSVSDDALGLYASEGIRWVSTDEDILVRSLSGEGIRLPNGVLALPEVLYRPYGWESDAGSIAILFRDRQISDLISFHYSTMDPKEAAADCLKRIGAGAERAHAAGKGPFLLTIAMDGENAWEYYQNDGRDFLSYLYEGILKDNLIIPTTISGFLDIAGTRERLNHCYAGSWINHNFSIWIGHDEDNRAWDLLAAARDVLGQEDPDRTNRDAWESILIAEGSDWFWWYGDEHSSESDEIFDLLFRENVMNVYRFLGKEPPDELAVPIITEGREAEPVREPVSFMYPVIDGMVTDYFDWLGAGYVAGIGHGTAMHQAVPLIKGLYYGFDPYLLFLRLDLDQDAFASLKKSSFEVAIAAHETLRFRYSVGDEELDGPAGVRAAFGEIFEAAVPFAVIGVLPGQTINVSLSVREGDIVVERIPARGILKVKVPSETFETEMWHV
jgi:alpha-amylase/alpha-mannosidase (GH57 family)